MAKEKVKKRNTANRLTRSDRISKRLRNVSADSAFNVKKAQFTVRVFAEQLVEIGGYLVEVADNYVMLRHKRTSASKRMIVSRFDTSKLVEVFGAVGEISSVSLVREVLVREVVGSVSETKSGVLKVTTPAGETVILREVCGTRFEVVADDEEGSSGKKGKKVKKAKAEKPAKKGKKKRKADEDDDDLDD